ncbi:hypothetical protein QFZ58_006573 [Streptomyces sp. B1I3]|nr:hypothetical protein [Streptomyces sp. B1I3]
MAAQQCQVPGRQRRFVRRGQREYEEVRSVQRVLPPTGVDRSDRHVTEVLAEHLGKVREVSQVLLLRGGRGLSANRRNVPRIGVESIQNDFWHVSSLSELPNSRTRARQGRRLWPPERSHSLQSPSLTSGNFRRDVSKSPVRLLVVPRPSWEDGFPSHSREVPGAGPTVRGSRRSALGHGHGSREPASAPAVARLYWQAPASAEACSRATPQRAVRPGAISLSARTATAPSWSTPAPPGAATGVRDPRDAHRSARIQPARARAAATRRNHSRDANSHRSGAASCSSSPPSGRPAEVRPPAPRTSTGP